MFFEAYRRYSDAYDKMTENRRDRYMYFNTPVRTFEFTVTQKFIKEAQVYIEMGDLTVEIDAINTDRYTKEHYILHNISQEHYEVYAHNVVLQLTFGYSVANVCSAKSYIQRDGEYPGRENYSF